MMGYGWVHQEGSVVPFLVTEFAQFGTLRQYLCSENISIRACFDLVGQVACGLREVHDSTVVHGDLKLENILVFKNASPEHENHVIAKITFLPQNASKLPSRVQQQIYVETKRYALDGEGEVAASAYLKLALMHANCFGTTFDMEAAEKYTKDSMSLGSTSAKTLLKLLRRSGSCERDVSVDLLERQNVSLAQDPTPNLCRLPMETNKPLEDRLDQAKDGVISRAQLKEFRCFSHFCVEDGEDADVLPLNCLPFFDGDDDEVSESIVEGTLSEKEDTDLRLPFCPVGSSLGLAVSVAAQTAVKLRLQSESDPLEKPLPGLTTESNLEGLSSLELAIAYHRTVQFNFLWNSVIQSGRAAELSDALASGGIKLFRPMALLSRLEKELLYGHGRRHAQYSIVREVIAQVFELRTFLCAPTPEKTEESQEFKAPGLSWCSQLCNGLSDVMALHDLGLAKDIWATCHELAGMNCSDIFTPVQRRQLVDAAIGVAAPINMDICRSIEFIEFATEISVDLTPSAEFLATRETQTQRTKMAVTSFGI
ncbi:uncharacterized protein K452DRAFT_294261 [Aplosporella prunicola CBS 121167]|uniref:Protein kinase domain-containing protein n=1 Tax=Aplosporella prunicola CBS 121167 TaxID=1176127 RepID=A0A6A6BTK4_9PEZI|nr:uncharacterized protein K452DRAFT_294261 [Aplosporella prunicola CBS 121167]KAF2146713.1 hypothetical protein K452DRAFT_294261 [Aplosporella prunicola CBS 121167]